MTLCMIQQTLSHTFWRSNTSIHTGITILLKLVLCLDFIAKKAVSDTLLGVSMMVVCNKEKKPEIKSTVIREGKNIALESGNDDDITRSVESNTSGAPETSKKEDMADVMCKMQFSNMTGCTFNFSI